MYKENCHSLWRTWFPLPRLGFHYYRLYLFRGCGRCYPALFCILENIIHRIYMSKGIKKTDNYFERVKQRANRTNYRYYFFDYLYFKGEVWGKKIGRMSGFILLFWYWWWVVVLPGNFLLINSVPECFCLFMYLFLHDTGKPVYRHCWTATAALSISAQYRHIFCSCCPLYFSS